MREFSGFGRFGEHLLALAAVGEEVTHHLTAEAGKLVQSDAKRRLGEYQDYTGPFKSWAELADSTKEDRVRQGYPENEPLLRSGEMRDSIEVSAHGNEVVVGSADPVALYQEVGTESIPPRPFLGPALFSGKNDIVELCATTVMAWIGGRSWMRPRLKSLPSGERVPID